MLQSFHFLRPEWLIALPFIALLLLLIKKRSKQNSGWESVCDAELLKFQLARHSAPKATSIHLLQWFVPITFFITIIALAGPSWEKKQQPVFQQGNALIVLLDLSLSMNAQDIKPSRLERAKLKLIDILKRKKEGQTALIAFAGDAHVVSPLTIDNKTIMSLLPALDSSIMPLTGSDLIDAIKTARQLFKNAGFIHGDILLISDGIDTSQKHQLEIIIDQVYQQGYRFSVIGVGSQTGSPIPLAGQRGFIKDQSGQIVLSKLASHSLTALAHTGHGHYHKLSLDDSDFKALIDNQWNTDKAANSPADQLEQWLDAGAYLSLLLIPLVLLNFRKGLLSIAIIILVNPFIVSEPAYAIETTAVEQQSPLQEQWQQLWSTADQLGQQDFNAHQYQQAAKHFNNKNWQAGAQYRAGNFAQAVDLYQQSDDAVSLFNKGNALANMQKFKEAAQAYQQALKQHEDFADAQKNLDYMKQLLAQQEQKNKQSQQQKKGDKKNQQKDQQNKSDDAEKDSDSKSDKNEQKNAKNSASQGSQSGQQEQKESSAQDKQQDKQNKAPDNKDNSDEQANEAKSPEDYQQKNHDKDQQNEQAKNAQAENKTEATDKDKKQQAHAAEQNDEQQEASAAENSTNDIMSQLSQEEQQSLQQWLQRIPDNPGRLLKIKFRNNTLLKQRQADSATQYEGKPW